MGNVGAINEGKIQVMSARTGVYHSEYKKNPYKPNNLIQLWVMQNKYNAQPRYDQKSVRELKKKNAHFQVLSPNKVDDTMWIHQSAWFHLVDFEKSTESEYEIKKEGNSVYIFVIEGEFKVENHRLKKRDALRVLDAQNVSFISESNSKTILVEVPICY